MEEEKQILYHQTQRIFDAKREAVNDYNKLKRIRDKSDKSTKPALDRMIESSERICGLLMDTENVILSDTQIQDILTTVVDISTDRNDVEEFLPSQETVFVRVSVTKAMTQDKSTTHDEPPQKKAKGAKKKTLLQLIDSYEREGKKKMNTSLRRKLNTYIEDLIQNRDLITVLILCAKMQSTSTRITNLIANIFKNVPTQINDVLENERLNTIASVSEVL